jgi:hypothetical protein
MSTISQNDIRRRFSEDKKKAKRMIKQGKKTNTKDTTLF